MVEVLGVLCLVFDKVGIVIVGNVFGINDGVVVLVIMEEFVVLVVGFIFLVCIKSYVSGGVFFVLMGMGLVFVM